MSPRALRYGLGMLVLVVWAEWAIAGTSPLEPPREVIVNGVELVLIPAGWAWHPVEVDTQHLPAGSSSYRAVRVWVEPFYLARYEARASDLLRFFEARDARPEHAATVVRDEGSKRAGRWEACSLLRGTDGRWSLVDPYRDLPATGLNWSLANDFAGWMGLRLPTEAQWVRGARGADRRTWPWGDDFPDDTYGHFGWIGVDCDPMPVDSHPKGRSPFGMHHMAGNVTEFVQDRHDPLRDAALLAGVPLPLRAVPSDQDSGELRFISKGGLWSASSFRTRIEMRRPVRPDHSSAPSGVRFAADVATVLAMLRGSALPEENKP